MNLNKYWRRKFSKWIVIFFTRQSFLPGYSPAYLEEELETQTFFLHPAGFEPASSWVRGGRHATHYKTSTIRNTIICK